MRAFSLILLSGLMMTACSQEPAAPKFSTFSDHIMSVARQDGISLGQAAQWVRSIGIDGVEARVTMTDEQIASLDSAGIVHAYAILDLGRSTLSPEEIIAQEESAIAFCRKHGFENLAYCPKFIPEGASEAYKDSVRHHLGDFVSKVKAAGLGLVFENIENPGSIIYNDEAIDAFLKAAPDAQLAFDIGNSFFAGDDPQVSYERFKKNIKHLHLKDRYAPGDRQSPPLGVGVVANREILDQALQDGYDDWFAIEGYGAKDMKAQLEISVTSMTSKPE